MGQLPFAFHRPTLDRKAMTGTVCAASPARAAAAALIAVASLSFSARATTAEGQIMLARSPVAPAYADPTDLLTAYGLAMTRYRLALIEKGSFSSFATTLTPAGNNARSHAWTWRATDGSLLQRLSEGGFRLVAGDCLQRFCSSFECHDAGWPVFTCDDGRNRKMSAPEFSSVTFDGVVYRRLSAAASAGKPKLGGSAGE